MWVSVNWLALVVQHNSQLAKHDPNIVDGANRQSGNTMFCIHLVSAYDVDDAVVIIKADRGLATSIVAPCRCCDIWQKGFSANERLVGSLWSKQPFAATHPAKAC